jgi:hypothetical protein
MCNLENLGCVNHVCRLYYGGFKICLRERAEQGLATALYYLENVGCVNQVCRPPHSELPRSRGVRIFEIANRWPRQKTPRIFWSGMWLLSAAAGGAVIKRTRTHRAAGGDSRLVAGGVPVALSYGVALAEWGNLQSGWLACWRVCTRLVCMHRAAGETRSVAGASVRGMFGRAGQFGKQRARPPLPRAARATGSLSLCSLAEKQKGIHKKEFTKKPGDQLKTPEKACRRRFHDHAPSLRPVMAHLIPLWACPGFVER